MKDFPGINKKEKHHEKTKHPQARTGAWHVSHNGRRYWKGSGLSLALDLIASALAGGRTTRQVGELPLETELSQVFICINLDSLPDKENIAANVEATLRDMETSTPVEEGRPVHFPGAHMAEVRSDNMENGIPVEDAIWQQVLAL